LETFLLIKKKSVMPSQPVEEDSWQHRAERLAAIVTERRRIERSLDSYERRHADEIRTNATVRDKIVLFRERIEQLVQNEITIRALYEEERGAPLV
jgi:hypothetical protein